MQHNFCSFLFKACSMIHWSFDFCACYIHRSVNGSLIHRSYYFSLIHRSFDCSPIHRSFDCYLNHSLFLRLFPGPSISPWSIASKSIDTSIASWPMDCSLDPTLISSNAPSLIHRMYHIIIINPKYIICIISYHIYNITQI